MLTSIEKYNWKHVELLLGTYVLILRQCNIMIQYNMYIV